MPNMNNVKRPVALIGLGRSGTTLLQAAFGRLPEFQVCGETGGMIAALWAGAHTSYMNNDFTAQQNLGLKQPDKPPHYIRACMCALCPTDKDEWFHKPIGLPKFLNWDHLPGHKSEYTGFPVEWYWNTLDEAFPDSRYITTVRSPWDVVLSRREHTGWDMQGMLKDIETTYEIYASCGDRLRQVVFFDDLVSQPRKVLKEICDAVEVDFRPGKMLKAFERFHAPVKGRDPKKDHRELWKDFEGLTIRQQALDRIHAFWQNHGRELDVPPGLVAM